MGCEHQWVQAKGSTQTVSEEVGRCPDPNGGEVVTMRNTVGYMQYTLCRLCGALGGKRFVTTRVVTQEIHEG